MGLVAKINKKLEAIKSQGAQANVQTQPKADV